jgi:hypothetical protein
MDSPCGFRAVDAVFQSGIRFDEKSFHGGPIRVGAARVGLPPAGFAFRGERRGLHNEEVVRTEGVVAE